MGQDHELLFWVPLEHREDLCLSHIEIIWGRPTKVDFSRFRYGSKPSLMSPLASTASLAGLLIPKANHDINCLACSYNYLSCCSLEEGVLFAIETGW